jgi:hypothetical protein
VNPLKMFALYSSIVFLGCTAGSPEPMMGSETDTITGPTTITVTAVSSSRIDLSWSALSGASAYTVYQSAGGAAYEYMTPTPIIATTFSSAGLSASVQYCYSIQALFPDGSLSTPTPPSCAVTIASPITTQIRYSYSALGATVTSGFSPVGGLAQYMASTAPALMFEPLSGIQIGDVPRSVTTMATGSSGATLTVKVFWLSPTMTPTQVGRIDVVPDGTWRAFPVSLSTTTMTAYSSLVVEYSTSGADIKVGTVGFDLDR